MEFSGGRHFLHWEQVVRAPAVVKDLPHTFPRWLQGHKCGSAAESRTRVGSSVSPRRASCAVPPERVRGESGALASTFRHSLRCLFLVQSRGGLCGAPTRHGPRGPDNQVPEAWVGGGGVFCSPSPHRPLPPDSQLLPDFPQLETGPAPASAPPGLSGACPVESNHRLCTPIPCSPRATGKNDL